MAGLIDKLDTTDLRILKILQEDGCISNLDLSARVGLSPTPTFERVKKMEKLHIIKGYHAELDSNLLGMGIETLMMVSLSQTKGNSVENFLRQVSEIEEIVECYRITGSYDYVFKIMVKDIASYEHLAMEKIRPIKEVGSIQSMVILSTIKKSKVIPLPYK